jgi:hypothetical protein
MAGLDEVLERLVTDPSFRQRLREDPAAALQGYDLAEADLELLAHQLDEQAGAGHDVEQRTSKSTLFGMLSEGFTGDSDPAASAPTLFEAAASGEVSSGGAHMSPGGTGDGDVGGAPAGLQPIWRDHNISDPSEDVARPLVSGAVSSPGQPSDVSPDLTAAVPPDRPAGEVYLKLPYISGESGDEASKQTDADFSREQAADAPASAGYQDRYANEAYLRTAEMGGDTGDSDAGAAPAGWPVQILDSLDEARAEEGLLSPEPTDGDQPAGGSNSPAASEDR